MKLSKKELKAKQAYYAIIKRKRKQIDKRAKRSGPTVSQLISAQAKAEGLSYGKFMAKLYSEAVKLKINEHQYFMKYYLIANSDNSNTLTTASAGHVVNNSQKYVINRHPERRILNNKITNKNNIRGTL